MSTCNRLDLQTLGSQPVMSKTIPDHWSGHSVIEVIEENKQTSIKIGLQLRYWYLLGVARLESLCRPSSPLLDYELGTSQCRGGNQQWSPPSDRHAFETPPLPKARSRMTVTPLPSPWSQPTGIGNIGIQNIATFIITSYAWCHLHLLCSL